MRAEIVMIGTELLLGEIIDTNAAKLAHYLRDIGMDLYYKTTVGDNEQRITDVLNLALDRSDAILTSGGIGPTVDDITRQAVANATGRKLVYSRDLEAQIATRFRRFGREMAENNKRQAYLPEGAMPIENPVGTAPCFLSDDVTGRGFIVSLPGVPRELTHMMENIIQPILIERMGGAKVLRVRVLRTCAVGESNVDRAIGDLMSEGNPTVGLAAHIGQTDVRITAKADTEEEADALIDGMEAKLRERLGIAVYAVGKATVPEVVGQLLRDRGLRVGLVDTLTGGRIASDLSQAGFEDRITADHQFRTLQQALDALPSESGKRDDPGALAGALARAVCPDGGVGLALLGPFENDATGVAVVGPDGAHILEKSRNYSDSDHIRQWLATQALDWVRRVVLGELESPVDWN